MSRDEIQGSMHDSATSEVHLHRGIRKMPAFADVKQKNMPSACACGVLASLALAWPMTH
jgi:hypothetical protein